MDRYVGSYLQNATVIVLRTLQIIWEECTQCTYIIEPIKQTVINQQIYPFVFYSNNRMRLMTNSSAVIYVPLNMRTDLLYFALPFRAFIWLIWWIFCPSSSTLVTEMFINGRTRLCKTWVHTYFQNDYLNWIIGTNSWLHYFAAGVCIDWSRIIKRQMWMKWALSVWASRMECDPHHKIHFPARLYAFTQHDTIHNKIPCATLNGNLTHNPREGWL